ncbi:MAG: hypothetical protein JKX69_12940 [Rhodobacteraceae bacterium]|nr:hypothetical protein [Paracoccaceae bacterium]
MGFPFENATWDGLDGAMFMGWGGIMPGVYTAISVLICVYVLWAGNRAEQQKYKAFENK